MKFGVRFRKMCHGSEVSNCLHTLTESCTYITHLHFSITASKFYSAYVLIDREFFWCVYVSNIVSFVLL